ncbi:MAG: chromosome segregation protein SMC [Myxococcota bacterium]
MKIRRLEIQGFKSFADRTVLKFGEGITGVVGPNGCGKSNIVDAIRWVMGEQSAKHLRGAGMQDVIFAGCETRGPAGMSEVSITFRNDGNLVPPEYQQHEEIQVTRRLFRDGTSEYAINKVQCRLRDILDLFMGTGIGKNAYAIIEQGRIGMIVTARPEERRALIEDAAGVSRYKARRKQAERRIAATEQNLVRVTDLVTELGSRLKVLDGQAARAEKYKKIKVELRDLDLHAAAHKRLELDALERFDRARRDGLQETLTSEQEGVEADEAAIAEATEALAVRESDFRVEEAKLYEDEKSLDLSRQNVEFLRREDGKLAERIEEAEVEHGELEEERARLTKERTEVEALEASLGEGAGEESRVLEAREVALNALHEQMAEARHALDADKASMVEHLTAVAERRNGLENLSRRMEDLELRSTKAEQDAQASKARSEDTKKRVAKLEAELTRSRQMKLQLEEEQASQEATLERLREAADEVDTKLSSSREALVNERSRLRSLEKIRDNYEGCSSAVRAVMKREETSPRCLVADVLDSDPRYETAVEAVLGERLQSIVVPDQDEAFESGQFLRSSEQGRSTFVPLDLRLDHAPWAPRLLTHDPSTMPPAGRPAELTVPSSLAAPSEAVGTPDPSDFNSTVLPAPLEESVLPQTALTHVPGALEVDEKASDAGIRGSEGFWEEEEEADWPNLEDASVCGKMTDLVRAKPGYEHVARALMGDVLVVDGLEKAHELWVNNGHRKTLVTLEGEVLDPMGLFTGGSSAGVSEGLLAQKREMDELRKSVAQLEAQVAAAETRKRDLAAKIEKVQLRVRDLSSEGQRGALSIVGFERDIESLRAQIARESELADRAAEEATRMRAELEAATKEQSATEAALDRLGEEKTEAEHRVADAAEGLADLERRARDLSDQITSLKVDVAANREKRDSSRQNLGRICARLDDIDLRLDKLAAIVRRSSEEREEGATKVRDEKVRIEELEQGVQARRQAVEALRAELDAEREALKSREGEVRTRRDALEAVRSEHAGAEMKIREYQIARENLQSQLKERYQIDLEGLLHDFHVLPRQSDEHSKRTRSLRRQLSDIGAINLTAIEEHAEVKARYEHLAGQKADLEKAIEALRSAIRKINKTSRERFVEAFRLVNEKFQQVFPKVFNGGRCALVMSDEEDPLESGIEIMAQPPGKKLQSVNLLSGGEKALTAVSLIFGIFLIKPTPFCLLDEVDAPLDEANVGRYNEMLREMAPISQFVLITHNKRTMELPDRLYGVTMEVPGISKIVPVDVVGSESEKTPELKAV